MAGNELVIKFRSDGTATVVDSLGQVTNKVAQLGQQSGMAKTYISSLSDHMKNMHGPLNAVGKGLEIGAKGLVAFTGGLTIAAAAVTTLGLSMVSGLIKPLIETGLKMNALFERTEMSFGVILKSASMAKRVLEDLKAIAATTPFEINEVIEFGRLLTAYGLNYTYFLKTAGNLVSAFAGDARDMTMVITAMGRISVGQFGEANRELRKFGINLMELPGLSRKGLHLISSPIEVLEALKAYIDTKYPGMMDKMSRTTTGILRNISDAWKLFAADVTKDAFDKLSAEGKDMFDWMRKLRESGDLQAFAKDVGSALAWVIKGVVGYVDTWRVAWPELKKIWIDTRISFIKMVEAMGEKWLWFFQLNLKVSEAILRNPLMRTLIPSGVRSDILKGAADPVREMQETLEMLRGSVTGLNRERNAPGMPSKYAQHPIARQIWEGAIKAGADPYTLLATAIQESGLRPHAMGDYEKGKPTSFGLFQHHIGGALGTRHPLWALDAENVIAERAATFAKARAVGGVGAAGIQRPAAPREYAKSVDAIIAEMVRSGAPPLGAGPTIPGRDLKEESRRQQQEREREAAKRAKDQKRVLEEQERDLSDLYGGEFQNRRVKAEQHYKKQRELAHGNRQAEIQAEKIYVETLRRIKEEEFLAYRKGLQELQGSTSAAYKGMAVDAESLWAKVSDTFASSSEFLKGLTQQGGLLTSVLGKRTDWEGIIEDFKEKVTADWAEASTIRRRNEEEYMEWEVSMGRKTSKQLLDLRIQHLNEEIDLKIKLRTAENAATTDAQVKKLQQQKEMLQTNAKTTGDTIGQMISGTIDQWLQAMIKGQQQAGDFFKNLWSNLLSWFVSQITKPMSEFISQAIGGLFGQKGGGGGQAGGAGQAGGLGGLLGGGIGKMLGWAGLAAGIITSLFPKVEAKTTHENRNIFLPEIDKTFQAMSELFITPIKTVQTFIEEQKDGPNIHRIYTYLEKEMGTVWTKLGEMFPQITQGVQRVYDQLQNANQMVQGLEKGFIAGGPQDVEKWKGIADQFKQFASLYTNAMEDAAKKTWPNIVALALESGQTVDRTIQQLISQGGVKAEQFASIYQKKLDELTGAVTSVGAKLVDKLIGMTFGWQVPGSSALWAGSPGKPKSALTQMKPPTATFGGLQQFVSQQGLGGMFLPQGAYENYLAGGGKDTLQDFLYGYMKPQMGYNNPAWNVPDAYVQQYLASLTTGGGSFAGRLAEGSTAQAPWQQPIMSTMMGQFPKIKNLIEKIRSTMALGTDEAAQGEATGYAQQLEQQWTQLIGTKAPQIKEQAFFAGQNVIDYFLNLLTQGNQTAIQIMGDLEGTMGTFFGEKAKDAIQEAIKTSGNAFIDFWVKTVIPDFTKMGYSSFRAPWGGKLDTVFNQIFNQMSGGTDLAKSEFGGVAGQAQDLFTSILTKKVSDIKKLAFYSGQSIYEYFEQMLSSGSQTAVDVLNEFQGRFDEIFQDSKDAINNATAANKLPFTVYEMVRSLSSGATTAVLSGVYTPQIGRDMPASVLPMFGQATFNINLSIPPGASVDTIAAMLQEAVMQSTMNRTQYFTSVG